MRSLVAKRIMANTPMAVKIHSRWMASLAVLIHQSIVSKQITQKELAANIGKQPSEISKWLSGEHNFTLNSLAKLQAELGVTLLQIPVETKSSHFWHEVNGVSFYITKPIAKKSVAPYTWQKITLQPTELLSDVG
jgi:transcriptional regulator with XRE-family HTH domain